MQQIFGYILKELQQINNWLRSQRNATNNWLRFSKKDTIVIKEMRQIIDCATKRIEYECQ